VVLAGEWRLMHYISLSFPGHKPPYSLFLWRLERFTLTRKWALRAIYFFLLFSFVGLMLSDNSFYLSERSADQQIRKERKKLSL
jgi:hypothetical protein